MIITLGAVVVYILSIPFVEGLTESKWPHFDGGSLPPPLVVALLWPVCLSIYSIYLFSRLFILPFSKLYLLGKRLGNKQIIIPKARVIKKESSTK